MADTLPSDMLRLAAKNGDLADVRLCLDDGADVNARDGQGVTALHYASYNGNLMTVTMLLEHGAKVNARNSVGKSALHLAAMQNQTLVVLALLEGNADPRLKDANGCTALHCAAQHGCLNSAQALLDSGELEPSHINMKDSKGSTALHYAAQRGSASLAMCLLESGAEGSLVNGEGMTAEQLATDNNHESVTLLFSDFTAAFLPHAGESHDLRKELLAAAKSGDEEAVQRLITQGADVQAGDANGSSALHLACAAGHEGVANALVISGCPVDTLDAKQQTPLHRAATAGHTKLVQALLLHGADTHAPDASGATPLHAAAAANHAAAVGDLLAENADAFLPDMKGRTACDVARRGTPAATLLSQHCQRLLAAAGGADDPGAWESLAATSGWATWRSPETGGTLLHTAAISGSPAAAARLLELAPEMCSTPDAQGLTPLLLATRREDEATVRAMLQAMAGDAPLLTRMANSPCGSPPLHDAAARGSTQIAKALLESGVVAMEARDKAQKTALRVAADHNNEGMARLLVAHNAMVTHDVLAAAHKLGGAMWDLMESQGSADHRVQVWGGPHVSTQHPERALVYAAACAPGARVALRPAGEEMHAALRCLRDGSFSIATDTQVLVQQGLPDLDLYLALAYGRSEACDAEDVADALQRYEASRIAPCVGLPQKRLEGVQFNALYFLAHARLAQRQGQADLATGLCSFLDSKHPGASAWMTEAERAAVAAVRSGVFAAPQRAAAPAACPAGVGRLSAAQRKPLDDLLGLVGLERVKTLAVELYLDALGAQRHGSAAGSPVAGRHLLLAGPPGCGKAVVARCVAGLLHEAGVCGPHFARLRASELQDAATAALALRVAGGEDAMCGSVVEVDGGGGQRVPAAVLRSQDDGRLAVRLGDGSERVVDAVGVRQVNPGGVLFLEDVGAVVASEGRACVRRALSIAERHADCVTVVLAGRDSEVLEELIVATRPDVASHFATWRFDGFTASQLGELWGRMCEAAGCDADDAAKEIVKHRLEKAARRGRASSAVVKRTFTQGVASAKRRVLTSNQPATADRAGLLFEAADIVGCEPTRGNLPALDEALREVDDLVGLARVKKALHHVAAAAVRTHKDEVQGKRVPYTSPHRLFLGNSGMGKSVVAQLYARILRALGHTSTDEVVVVAAHHLAAEARRSVLRAAHGKLLVVRGMHTLGDREGLDVLRALSCAALEDDGPVLVLCGKAKPLTDMVRFAPLQADFVLSAADTVEFDDFSDDELLHLLSRDCVRHGVRMPIAVKQALVSQVSMQRGLAHFANAATLRSHLHDATARMRHRADTASLCVADLHSGGDPLKHLQTLGDVGGFKKHVTTLVQRIRLRHAEGRPVAQLLRKHVFVGGRGTGKMTAARTMAAVLHSMGLLPTDNTRVLPALALCTDESLRAGLHRHGGLLYVNTLSGVLAHERVRELVATLVTAAAAYDGVAVLAGSEAEVTALRRVEDNVHRVAPEVLLFPDWTSQQCCGLVVHLARQAVPHPYVFEQNAKSKHAVEGSLVSLVQATLVECFEVLRSRPGWGNASDAVLLFREMERHREGRLVDTADHVCKGIAMRDVAAACEALLRARPKPAPKAAS